MNSKHLGDSYDLVKRVLLDVLKGFGKWSVLHMPTNKLDIASYEKLLGAKVSKTDKGDLFVDPDNGIALKKKSPKHILIDTLIAEIESRPDSLILVFDQSFSRGKEKEGRKKKQRRLRMAGIYSFYYGSHASFLVAGKNKKKVEQAQQRLLGLGIPQEKLSCIA